MTADPSVRLAYPEDAEDIAAMSRTLIERGLPWTWRPARVLGAIRDPDTNVAVVRMDGDLVAFGIMEYLEADAYLTLLAVRPAKQRRGIGSSLLRWLETSARIAGVRRIRLEARRDNLADEQIAFALKQAGLGISVEEVCRTMGITDATFHARRRSTAG